MKIRQNDLVLFNVIKEDEYGLLNPLTKKLHRINESGRFIWDACKEPKDIDQLASLVSEQYKIPLETAHKDVEEFVCSMVCFELLEEV
jgi:hypothetical protein